MTTAPTSSPTAPPPDHGLDIVRRALAETDVELRDAQHHYRRLVHHGGDMMAAKANPAKLEGQEGKLDHWAWHSQAMAQAMERHGLDPIPPSPLDSLRAKRIQEDQEGGHGP